MNSRADLLRTLAQVEQAEVKRAKQSLAKSSPGGISVERIRSYCDLLGFGVRDEPRHPMVSCDKSLPPVAVPQPPVVRGPDFADEVLYTAQRPVSFWTVVRCNVAEAVEPDTVIALPLADSRELPPATQAWLPAPGLRSAGQWQNLWDEIVIGRGTGCGRGRRVDLKRCLRELAQARPLSQLPLQSRRHFNGPITVIFDRPVKLRQAFDDMLTAWLSLRALVGPQGLSGFILRDGPDGWWERLDDTLSLGSEAEIKPGSQLILMGAFGGLESGQMGTDWQALLARLKARGHGLHVLPVCALQGVGVQQTPLDPRQGSGQGGGEDTVSLAQSVAALLAALAHTWKVSSQQLRYLRHALPAASLQAELQVANHPQVVDSDVCIELHADYLSEQLQAFAGLDAGVQQRLDTAIEAWRETRNARAIEMERLQASLLAPPSPEAFPRLLQQLAAFGERAVEERDEVPLVLRSYLPLLTLLAQQTDDAKWQPVLRAARKVAVILDEPLPGGYHPAEWQAQADAEPRWLRQLGQGLVLGADSRHALLKLSAAAYAPGTGKMLGGAWGGGADVGTDTLELEDGIWHYGLHRQALPPWAERIWQNGQGLIHAAHADGAVFVLEQASERKADSSWECVEHGWDWASDTGIDEHGLWAAFQVGRASQRMRWIPPGSFVMGSPEDEAGRYNDETQHRVTLTQGYWLAETTCSRGLWAELKGQVPGRDADLPVSNINWNDCQNWINRLNGYLPGLTWRLPTEAEWEYACRAGTETAYWWGESMDEDFTNNSGGIKAESTYPANPFGLRSMSGNVWEWCEDWSGSYPTDAVVDPSGAQQGQARVLRGGCWLGGGRLLRSAYRYGFRPDDRYHYVGLRLAGGVDPQASQQGVARRMTADCRERSGRRGSGQVAGGLSGQIPNE